MRQDATTRKSHGYGALMLMKISRPRSILARIVGALVRRPCEYCGAVTPAAEPYCSPTCARRAQRFDLNP